MDEIIKPIFEASYVQDSLTVVGKGLGLQRLFMKYVQFYCRQDKERKLVFCINAIDLAESLCTSLLREEVLPQHLPQLITNEVLSDARVGLYKEGGCFIVTSRILIVDLLDGKIDQKDICGLLVYDAHRIVDTSMESFIIRVYRQKNRVGFLKAFSDEPELLTNGFAKVERLMKLLYVTKIQVWPRFEPTIAAVLTKAQPEVIELSQPMTETMNGIQSSILVALKSTLEELKRATPQLEGMIQDATLEQALFKHFDLTVRSVLDPEWHRLSPRTKQLVGDLTQLRQLLDYLLRYDPYSFYCLLLTMRSTSSLQSTPSLWLTSVAAEHIFQLARNRVFRLIPISGVSRVSSKTLDQKSNLTHEPVGSNLGSRLEAVRDCPPKWRLLIEIIQEIRTEQAQFLREIQEQHKTEELQKSPKTCSANWFRSNGRVLLLVKDTRTAAQLRDCLSHGVDYVLDQRHRWFVSQQCAELRNRTRSRTLSSQNGSRKRRRSGVVAAGPSRDADNIEAAEEQFDLEDAPEVEERNEILEPDCLLNAQKPSVMIRGDSTKSATDEVTNELGISDKQFEHLSLDQKLLLLHELELKKRTPVESQQAHLSPTQSMRSATNADWTFQDSVSGSWISSGESKTTKTVDTSDDDNLEILSQQSEAPRDCQYMDPRLQLLVFTHDEIRWKFDLLEEYKPQYVILYDPTVALVRQLEVYKAEHPYLQLKVYFLMYDGSSEEHRYISLLSREKKSFEKLMELKDKVVISLPDHNEDLDREKRADLELAGDSRVSRGKATRNLAVVVDVREFRCSLPSLLHSHGFALIPRTLTVADYVIALEICVERKGISDLFQSFNSGRLYNQVQAMSRYYKHVCLLIEFSGDKGFTLQGVANVSSDSIQANSITSKISLLALTFPNLRILWSKSPHATTDILRSIMQNHEPVDVNKAVNAGAGSLDGMTSNNSDAGELGSTEEELADQRRQAAQATLLSLPGITHGNFRAVMSSISNLADLSKKVTADLVPLIGQSNAKKLTNFFRQRTLESDG